MNAAIERSFMELVERVTNGPPLLCLSDSREGTDTFLSETFGSALLEVDQGIIFRMHYGVRYPGVEHRQVDGGTDV